MKQHEAVIKVMEENGGYATLSLLYQNAFKITGIEWKTKTPFASIRRIVQDARFFFKIKPGLWALKSYRQKLPADVLSLIDEDGKPEKEGQFTHSYYQGLVVEIGNSKGYTTYIPQQDQNKKFLNKELHEIIGLRTIMNFTYPKILDKVKSIDVWWFNPRNYPAEIFEIEHTTDFRNALIKFLELQDFMVRMTVVSAVIRKKEFMDRIGFTSFAPIKNRVEFITYDYVSQLHAKIAELQLVENQRNEARDYESR